MHSRSMIVQTEAVCDPHVTGLRAYMNSGPLIRDIRRFLSAESSKRWLCRRL